MTRAAADALMGVLGLRPEAMVVLAIDQSTRSSGWAVGCSLVPGEQRVIASDVARSSVDAAGAISWAVDYAKHTAVPLIAVLEDHRGFRFSRGNMSVKSCMGMGAARGRWEYALELAGVRDVRFVSPQTWRAKVLGLGQRVKGEVAKIHARNWAHALVGRPVGDDEAEALCMLMLALREPDALTGGKRKKPAAKRRKRAK